MVFLLVDDIPIAYVDHDTKKIILPSLPWNKDQKIAISKFSKDNSYLQYDNYQQNLEEISEIYKKMKIFKDPYATYC